MGFHFMNFRVFSAAAIAVLVLTTMHRSLAAPAAGGPPVEKLRRVLASLSTSERSQYEAARKRAVRDPNFEAVRMQYVAAREACRSLNKRALLQYNPSLAPALEKLETDRKRKPLLGSINELTPEERKKWTEAREATKTQPPLQQAEANLTELEERHRRALREAMLKADPGVATVLAKVETGLATVKPPRKTR